MDDSRHLDMLRRTMTLTSCVDNVDNPVIPVNPKEEIAKETFLHEDWMDRSVKPEDRVKIW